MTYPDELRMGGGIDEEIWGEEMDKVEEHFDEYISFHAMESHESFGMMEDFISLITDEKVRAKFEQIIQRRKPFQQFKYLLPDYPELRQQWFNYKEERYKEYVQEQLTYHHTEKEDHDDENDEAD